jgi:alpha-galactosidase
VITLTKERFTKTAVTQMISRREFLERGSQLTAGLSAGWEWMGRHRAAVLQAASSRTFLDLLRPPDTVSIQTTSAAERSLRLTRQDRWEDAGTIVTTSLNDAALRIQLTSPSTAVRRLRLRWRGRLERVQQLMGDAWERGYGDFEWRGFVPDRVMPWYFAAFDGRGTHAYGVRTGAKAFCFWQADPQGISLWADVRSGGAGVELGNRTLTVCEIVCRRGRADESAFSAIHAFCRQMCARPRLPPNPVYGSNDWYWAYGKNSADTVLTDTHHIVDLSPAEPNRPFAVIDDGWQPERGQQRSGVGTWDRGNEKFPDMPGLAAEIRRIGARPGIWIRPLLAPAEAPDSWRLPRDRAILDPTVPEALRKVTDDIARLRQWGYELIKHDYTTFDLFGRWGSTMGEALTRDGWTFATGPGRTTAEVIDDVYQAIRAAAAETLVIGCNTVSHLSAGVFEICRIGDDTSGREWARTRKMGVNTLAFRGAQHGVFYVADADCVGVTTAIPWTLNRQWLDVLARSGTMLFVSLAPDALGDAERRDLRAALALASRRQPLGEPLDWQRTSCPSRWRLMGREVTYDWMDAQ